MAENHQSSHSASYAAAGVDVTAGYETVKAIKPMVESTYIPGVMGGIGGFGGMFAPDMAGMERPVFVSGTDGVGTKLRLAFVMNKHNTIGIDCVAMCVNDIICAGAKPLFFLDYLATGKLVPQVASQIVSGVAEGCRQAGCALIGGETAEMPGFYADGEYDLAGFSVGMADEKKMIDGKSIQEGDVIIGLASSGLHSNGFSLVRHVLGDNADCLSEILTNGRSLGAELLTPTRIYVKSILSLIEQVKVKGISNITGGGWFENIPRMLPQGITARLDPKVVPVPHIFTLIQERGGIPLRDMYNTFNMGIGMVLAIESADAERTLALLSGLGERAFVLGQCVPGEGGVELV